MFRTDRDMSIFGFGAARIARASLAQVKMQSKSPDMVTSPCTMGPLGHKSAAPRVSQSHRLRSLLSYANCTSAT